MHEVRDRQSQVVMTTPGFAACSSWFIWSAGGLEVRAGVAPAAMLLASRDSIVVRGAFVAAEVYGIRLPILLLDASEVASLPRGGTVMVRADQQSACVC